MTHVGERIEHLTGGVQLLDQRQHGGIRQQGGGHRLQDGEVVGGRQAGARLGLTRHGMQGEGTPINLQPVGMIEQPIGQRLGASRPSHPAHYAHRIPAHHHPSQIEDNRHRHPLLISVLTIDGTNMALITASGPCQLPCPVRRPRASFTCIRRPNPLMVMTLHSGLDHAHTILLCFLVYPAHLREGPVVASTETKDESSLP
ncbi:hypothetical protein D3C79_514350 [compost metagenome]